MARRNRRREEETVVSKPQPSVLQVNSVINGDTLSYNDNVTPRELERKLLVYSYNTKARVLPVIAEIAWSNYLVSSADAIEKRLRGGIR